ALSLDHKCVRALTTLWSRIHWSSGDGMMPPEELLEIYRFAATWPVRGATVELGAWVGLTTSYLAAASIARRDGMVYAVDTFEGTKEGETHYPSVARYGGGTFEAFQDQIHRAGVADRVMPLVGLSGEVAERYAGGPIRMLLIDADHSYDGVRSDWERWSPHVAPGGLVVFHDYLFPDVARFVDGLVEQRDDIIIKPGRVLPNLYAVTKRTGPIMAAPVHSDLPVSTASDTKKAMS
ncbi:MAG: class I SAM-dependent methyltransferase, partial [Planctomycetes bacterium]|nr:class I SAM-dependent methyltransferase [Planctomycetota bacterium]